jgi:hypothetical protein
MAGGPGCSRTRCYFFTTINVLLFYNHAPLKLIEPSNLEFIYIYIYIYISLFLFHPKKPSKENIHGLLGGPKWR